MLRLVRSSFVRLFGRRGLGCFIVRIFIEIFFNTVKDIHKFIFRQTSPSKQPDKGTTDKPEHRESANISRVFSFSSLDDITNAACIIDTFYKDANSVYKNPSDRRYYLCISKNKCTSKDFNKVCNILSEYGQKESGFDNHIGFFAEHCECIIAEHALHILRRL